MNAKEKEMIRLFYYSHVETYAHHVASIKAERGSATEFDAGFECGVMETLESFFYMFQGTFKPAQRNEINQVYSEIHESMKTFVQDH